MAKKGVSVSEAELEILQVLWRAGEPVTAQYVAEAVKDRNWKYSTVATMFARMVEKGAVTYEKRGRFFYYTPLITEEAYRAEQTESLISKLYNGSVKNLVAALFENRQMSDEDLEELKKRFDL